MLLFSIPKNTMQGFCACVCALVLFSVTGCKQKADVVIDGLRVPEGFSIEKVAGSELLSYPMFASFGPDGRLFVFESTGKTTSTEEVLANPTFFVRVLEDENDDGIFDKSTIFADKIPYPMGGSFYQGSLYVAAPPDLIRFTDTNNDGVADKRDVILSGWKLHHNAATLSGPFIGPDGWFYLADARRGFNITTKEGDTLKGAGARIWRCRPDGTGLESVSGGGFDNAVELAFMPSGETLGTMTYFTDPRGGFRDAIMHWVEGGVHPKPHPSIEEDGLKLTGTLMPVMTKLARVSHAGLMRYRGAGWGDAFRDNLFTAQFNTGRIMRYNVATDRATFSTTEEPFLQCDSMDFHPTDVLQDADGSLLLVNTGGWFIAGCPLSVVAKADVMGGIYRIRKKDAKSIADPWGKKLDFANMTIKELTDKMRDERPFVRDKAIEAIVLKGDAAVTEISKSIELFNDDEQRAAAVFAVARIGTPAALQFVKTMLDDKAAMVRTAAARALGLAKDATAVDKLMQLVQQDQPAVRRQAATALGQIRDDRAITALLKAAAIAGDRFTEHAITHSLITIGKAQPLLIALADSSVAVRKAALIALDQMDGSPLQKQHLQPFLQSSDSTLSNTGIWVAMHHKNWSDVVVDFISKRFAVADSSEAALIPLRELIEAFISQKPLQDFIAARLNSPKVPTSQKRFLIELIAASDLEEIPATWVQPLAALLTGKDEALRLQVLGLIESRRITTLNKWLQPLVDNVTTAAPLRLRALAAKMSGSKAMANGEFEIVSSYLDASYESPVRQAAVRLLAQARLNDTQLLMLAKNNIQKADIFLLPALLQSFEGSKSEAVGHALITALTAVPDRLDNLSLPDLQKLVQAFPATVQSAAHPLIKKMETQHAARLSQLTSLEHSLGRGDVAEGRALFFGKATCSGCHAVVNEGGTFGPDLTNIGEIRSSHDLLEAIVYPSASFAREHETSKITTQNNSYTGIIKEQLPDAVVIATGPGTSVRIERKEIRSIEQVNVSVMPPGLDKILSKTELANLLAFLVALPDGLGQLESH